MEKIVILGCNGFLGQSLVNAARLTPNVETFGVDANNQIFGFKNESSSPSRLGDITDHRAAKSVFGNSIVIDSAWKGIPNLSIENTIRSINDKIQLIGILKPSARPRRWIGIGSCFEYQDMLGGCTVESAPTNNGSEFSIGKIMAREVVSLMCRRFSIDFIWVRPFFLFGNGQVAKSLLPTIAVAIRKGEAPSINNQKNIIDMIHVADASSQIIELAMKGLDQETYNIGSGNPINVGNLVREAYSSVDISLDHDFNSSSVPPGKPDLNFWASTKKTETIVGKTAFDNYKRPLDYLFENLVDES